MNRCYFFMLFLSFASSTIFSYSPMISIENNFGKDLICTINGTHEVILQHNTQIDIGRLALQKPLICDDIISLDVEVPLDPQIKKSPLAAFLTDAISLQSVLAAIHRTYAANPSRRAVIIIQRDKYLSEDMLQLQWLPSSPEDEKAFMRESSPQERLEAIQRGYFGAQYAEKAKLICQAHGPGENLGKVNLCDNLMRNLMPPLFRAQKNKVAFVPVTVGDIQNLVDRLYRALLKYIDNKWAF